ncbi:hypothetical protein DKX38_028892 [Salix brachista]|uniref:DUF8040 domain-containing protein n=1 Tax=Salix brachista TaxID=2182728 RepID=A0A5N5J2B5_9ROSI|nr:hypothetical protein DKX38_028892 [Salix brachista]
MAYVDEDGSSGSGEDVNMLDGHNKRQSVTPGASGCGKRSCKATGDAIVDAMLEIAAASKMRAAAIMKNEDQYSISKCIKVLDEMQGVDQWIYFLALDFFERPIAREKFIAQKSVKRLQWLQGKHDTLASMEDFDLELDKMELVAAAAGYYYYNSITRQPRQSSLPYGSSFMSEVLNGPDDGCQEMFRMDKHVFHNLCGILRQRGMLRDTAGVMIEEQLAIFLNIIGHNERNRVIQERFQHSGETISRHFNNVLKAIKSLSREFLQPPPIATPPEIVSSNRFYPYFKASFDVLKTRFPILKVAPQYGFHVQRDIVIAACVLHNYIRREGKDDWLFANADGVAVTELPDIDDESDIQLASSIQDHMAFSLRESIMGAMWNDFINKWDQW